MFTPVAGNDLHQDIPRIRCVGKIRRELDPQSMLFHRQFVGRVLGVDPFQRRDSHILRDEPGNSAEHGRGKGDNQNSWVHKGWRNGVTKSPRGKPTDATAQLHPNDPPGRQEQAAGPQTSETLSKPANTSPGAQPKGARRTEPSVILPSRTSRRGQPAGLRV